MPSLPVVWRMYHVANIPIHFGTLANVCPTFTLEFSDLHVQFTRCVANVSCGESSVANLPCGESSGNRLDYNLRSHNFTPKSTIYLTGSIYWRIFSLALLLMFVGRLHSIFFVFVRLFYCIFILLSGESLNDNEYQLVQ